MICKSDAIAGWGDTRTVDQLCLGGAGCYHVLGNERVSSEAVGKCAFHEQLRLHHAVTSILQPRHITQRRTLLNSALEVFVKEIAIHKFTFTYLLTYLLTAKTNNGDSERQNLLVIPVLVCPAGCPAIQIVKQFCFFF